MCYPHLHLIPNMGLTTIVVLCYNKPQFHLPHALAINGFAFLLQTKLQVKCRITSGVTKAKRVEPIRNSNKTKNNGFGSPVLSFTQVLFLFLNVVIYSTDLLFSRSVMGCEQRNLKSALRPAGTDCLHKSRSNQMCLLVDCSPTLIKNTTEWNVSL